MTQAELVEAVNRNTGQVASFNIKTLQRYERPEDGTLSNLEYIATALQQRLSRAVTVEECLF